MGKTAYITDFDDTLVHTDARVIVVDKDGNVTNPEIVRGCDEGDNFEKVAINAVNKLGKFSPAKMNGNPVSLKMTIPVKFSLN